MCGACHSRYQTGSARLFPFGAKAAPPGHLDSVEAARAPFEEIHTARAFEVILEQGEAAAAALEESGETAADVAVVEGRPLVASLYEDLYADVWPSFAAGVFDGLKSWLPSEAKASRDVWLAEALLWVQENAGVLISGVQSTTLKAVRSVIAQGIADGLGNAAIARELREVWPEIAAYRAERIARTEVITASNAGSQSGARSIRDTTGLELEKVWLATTGDGRTRDSHLDADAQRRGLDEPYDVGGHAAMYPADAALPVAERVQCRCTEYYEPVTP